MCLAFLALILDEGSLFIIILSVLSLRIPDSHHVNIDSLVSKTRHVFHR